MFKLVKAVKLSDKSSKFNVKKNYNVLTRFEHLFIQITLEVFDFKCFTFGFITFYTFGHLKCGHFKCPKV